MGRRPKLDGWAVGKAVVAGAGRSGGAGGPAARNGAVCEQEATKSVENRLTGGMRVLECVVSNSKQKRVRL